MNALDLRLTLARMSPRDERALWLSRHVLLHEPALRTWLARRPVAGLEIDDIIQETYFKLSSVPDVNAIDNVRGYLFRTAHSLIVSHVRRAQIVSISTFANMEDFQVLDDDGTPEERLVARDELRRLGEVVADMPPRAREVFVLRRIEGLSQRGVAERLGVSVSTVEKHLAKAMLRLSDAMARGGKGTTRASKGSEVSERSDATRN